MIRLCKMVLITVLAGLVLAAGALAQTARFAVIADPHFHDADLGTSGAAFEAYLTQDRKMLRESEAILTSALAGIREQKPDFVLVTGDLTKDGELSSHLKIAGHLADLEADGIEVYVIPGNHDINNPHAVAFDGDAVTPVENVSPERFAEIHGPFGFDQAIARDPDSLSYVAEPVPGTWLFAIDSCRYDDNIANDYPETGGSLSEASLTWLLEKLTEAKARRKTAVGFMHHGILEHYTGQSQLYADYVIQDWQTLSQTLSAAGLRLIFTGHYHANDITRSQWEANHLNDVETGSLVTYPSPYRLVDLHGPHAAVVRTFHVEEIDADTGDLSFPEYAEAFLRQGLTNIAAYQLTLPPAQGGFALTPAEAQAAAPSVAAAFMAHYAGDENPEADTQLLIYQYLNGADPRYQALGQALGTLWSDLAPADGYGVLALRPAIPHGKIGLKHPCRAPSPPAGSSLCARPCRPPSE